MRKVLSVLALAALVAALVAAGCANGDDSKTTSEPALVVKITMLDNKYEPSQVTVPKGREVTFEFTNQGTVAHEALVGDEQAQMDHAQEMMSSTSTDSGDMGGMHHSGAGSAITVKPGKSDSIMTTFDKAGTFLIGCHVPLHYEQGMKAAVKVS